MEDSLPKIEKRNRNIPMLTAWLLAAILVASWGVQWWNGDRLWEERDVCESYDAYGDFDCYDSMLNNCIGISKNPWLESCSCERDGTLQQRICTVKSKKLFWRDTT